MAMNMEKKYELTDKTMEFEGRVLHRIKATKDFNDVKAGDLGGWVENGHNLSYRGNCWIYNEAKAMDDSRIYDNARMFDEATARNGAKVFNSAAMYDDSIICDRAEMFGSSEMHDNTIMFGYSEMYSNSKMYDTARMHGNAILGGDAVLKGNNILRGTLICKADRFIDISNPEGRLVTGILVNGKVLYNVGCQEGMTKETFIDRIYNEDGGLERNPHRKEYLKIIDMIEMYLKD